MNYFGAAVLFLFLLGATSAGWYWLFKRFERRVSERFDEVTERVNENYRVVEMIIGRVDDLPMKSDKTMEMINDVIQKAEALDRKLDLLQGILLVIKQEQAIAVSLREGAKRFEEGGMTEEELARLTRILNDMRLENFSRF